MNPQQRSKNVVLWALVAGAVVGAASVGAMLNGRSQPLASAGPSVPPSLVRTAAEITPSSESLASLRALDASLSGLVEVVSPAVVHIRSESRNSSSVFGQPVMSGGQGSGFIFRPDGWILTNDHVVGGFEKVTVVLNDGRELPGTVKRAPESDIALVKVDAKDLPTLRLADSQNVKAGQTAIAIGAPFGLESSVTIGHVSAVGRTNVIPDQRTQDIRSYWDLIQTDASINMGNSGGPLINIEGEVIGINSAIVSPTGVNSGIGFAISSNQARMLAETLIERGKIVRSYMGVRPVNLKQYQKVERKLNGGALVEDVPSDGPAAAAGLRKGDIITKIGDTPVMTELDLRNSMLKYQPDTTVNVEFIRDGQTLTRQVKLENPPVQPVTRREAPNRPFRDQEMPREFQDRMREFFESPDGSWRDRTPGPREEAPRGTRPIRLGVSIQNVDETARTQYNIPKDKVGAVITSVEPNSVADRLGLKPGDLVEQLGSTKVTDTESLTSAMRKLTPSESPRIRVSRYSKTGMEVIEKSVNFR